MKLSRNGWLAGLIVLLALTACAGPRESTGSYVDDATITTKIKSQLVRDQMLKAFDIHVETYNGQVLLSGFVNSKDQADQAVHIAEGVAGVKSVKDSIVVQGS